VELPERFAERVEEIVSSDAAVDRQRAHGVVTATFCRRAQDNRLTPEALKDLGRAVALACLGLVLAVRSADRLLAEAQALAARIAASGPLATRGTKRIFSARTSPGFAEARALSDSLRHALEFSADIEEAAAAHLEGRRPRFTGR
jgi:hypothetical protein